MTLPPWLSLMFINSFFFWFLFLIKPRLLVWFLNQKKRFILVSECRCFIFQIGIHLLYSKQAGYNLVCFA